MDRRVEASNWRRVLTRISVSGAGDRFIVRSGDEGPVKVWVRGGSLRCECGASRCLHIESLILCGFYSAEGEEQRAA